jgi:hypothetical protein
MIEYSTASAVLHVRCLLDCVRCSSHPLFFVHASDKISDGGKKISDGEREGCVMFQFFPPKIHLELASI